LSDLIEQLPPAVVVELGVAAARPEEVDEPIRLKSRRSIPPDTGLHPVTSACGSR